MGSNKRHQIVDNPCQCTLKINIYILEKDSCYNVLFVCLFVCLLLTQGEYVMALNKYMNKINITQSVYITTQGDNNGITECQCMAGLLVSKIARSIQYKPIRKPHLASTKAGRLTSTPSPTEILTLSWGAHHEMSKRWIGSFTSL